MLKHKKRANRFAAAHSIEIEDGSHARLESEYPTRLNMYLKPPPSEVTIEEFEMFALDRLHGKTMYLLFIKIKKTRLINRLFQY
jgi:DNA primase large subunit